MSKCDLMAHFEDWVTDPDITLASLRRDFASDRSLVGARYGVTRLLTTPHSVRTLVRT
jgi:hypothetical protein